MVCAGMAAQALELSQTQRQGARKPLVAPTSADRT